MIQLFLLKPDFRDEKLAPAHQTYYCPECAWVEGILHYYPSLRSHMEVIYVDFPRPRPALEAVLGSQHQSCPALVFSPEDDPWPLSGQFTYARGLHFTNDKMVIARFFAEKWGIGLPHP
ncbi:DUF3088 family protein [Chitinophaga deserti]|uniref:DUF3088 family protein n=1 Tax=Chitinophaga deserti TaxID=2164099 RepID=UPI000D6AC502|nr:DUF3088 family protein [Chitinophaga deserti]